jgi:hypothetical protein
MANVNSRFTRNYYTVYRVIKQRHKDAEYLDEQQIRHVVDVLHMFIEHTRSAHSGRIGIDVNEIKNAERNYAGYLVQLA